MDLPEATNTDRLSQVDVTSDRGGADVEPVVVRGRELLGDAGLDGVNPAWVWSDSCMPSTWGVSPTGNGQLALALQEGRIGFLLLVRIERHWGEENSNSTHDELVGLPASRPLVSKIPSSEASRLPHSCSNMVRLFRALLRDAAGTSLYGRKAEEPTSTSRTEMPPILAECNAVVVRVW